MMVIIHVVAGAGIAHVASTQLRDDSDVGFTRPGPALLILVAVAGFVSHGILDGLKHGYVLSAGPDISAAAALAAAWCLAVHRPLRLLFAAVITAALLPDLIDHGTAMLQWKLGWAVSANSHRFFPWHWLEGSGSLHDGGNDPSRSLAFGRNRLVSITNQLIVLFIAAGCVLTTPRALRFLSGGVRAHAA